MGHASHALSESQSPLSVYFRTVALDVSIDDTGRVARTWPCTRRPQTSANQSRPINWPRWRCQWRCQWRMVMANGDGKHNCLLHRSIIWALLQGKMICATFRVSCSSNRMVTYGVRSRYSQLAEMHNIIMRFVSQMSHIFSRIIIRYPIRRYLPLSLIVIVEASRLTCPRASAVPARCIA